MISPRARLGLRSHRSMEGKNQDGSPRLLPDFPESNSVIQSETYYDELSTTSNTNLQTLTLTKRQMIKKFEESLTNLKNQLQVFNENLQPLLPELSDEKPAGLEISSQEMLPRNPRIGDAWGEEVSHTIELIIRSRDGYYK